MTQAIQAVTSWLQNIVIELNFCPFAKQEFIQQRIRFSESSAHSELELLTDLSLEFDYLSEHEETETTLLIVPHMLQDFFAYNQFLDAADSLLEQSNLVGVYQLASFHPDYQFAGTDRADAENFTNRSPFPVLHILREQSLERAIRQHPDTSLIPQTNIQTTENLGAQHMHKLLADCLNG